ncbi:hypothetical protein MAHJHV28_46940 [Mycobacterium avium subsp. hominissuis]
MVRTRMIAPTPVLGRLPGLSPDQAAQNRCGRDHPGPDQREVDRADVHAVGVHVSTVYFALVRTRMIAPTPVLGRLPGLSPDQAAAR